MPAHGSERNSTTKLLLVDPSESTRALIARQIPAARYTVIEARDGLSGWERFLKQRPCAVLSAFELPGLSGPDLLARVRSRAPTPFVFHTTRHDVRAAVSAMRQGADDVLVLPEHAELIPARLQTLVESRGRGGAAYEEALATVVGRSAEMRRLREQLAGAMGLRIPVLLRGERGSGRSHMASALARAEGSPLVTISSARPRSFQKSDTGRTIHLEEVDRFPLDLQARWTRELDAIEREEPEAPHRVVLSTTDDPRSVERASGLDPALAERLARFTIHVPSLRDRPGDIAHLARHLLSHIAERLGRRGAALSDRALTELRAQSWPGNVAELEGALEQLVAFAPRGRIGRREVLALDRPGASRVGSMRRAAEQEQRDELIALLRETRGNLAEAARRLGLSRGAVIYRAQKFGLMPRRTPRGARSR